MNWDHIEGNWRQFKGAVLDRWGKLTGDDFDRIAGSREKLLGVLQERYGQAREVVEKQVEEFRAGWSAVGK